MNYKAKLSRDELIAIQGHPNIQWARQNDYPLGKMKKHATVFKEYLHTKYPITKGTVSLTIHGKSLVPKKYCGDPIGGIAHCYPDRAEIHVAVKGRSLFSALCTIAHEYRHAVQIVQQQRLSAETHELEMDAIEFQCDALCQYLKEKYL